MTTPAVPAALSRLDPDAVLAVFATGAALAALAAVVLAVRRRDPLPVIVCAGALVSALNEPIYDLLGKIAYAPDNVMAYTAFGRHIPLFLVLGYVPWVGLLPYLCSRWMAAGRPRRRLHAVALASLLSVVAVETIGTSFGVWTYYGVPPLKYLGVAPQMAPMPLVGGMLLYVAGSRLRGWRRLGLIAVPTMALPATYAAVGWPMYVALHANVPKSLQYVAGIATVALCLALVVGATHLADRWRTAEHTLPPASLGTGLSAARAPGRNHRMPPVVARQSPATDGEQEPAPDDDALVASVEER